MEKYDSPRLPEKTPGQPVLLSAFMSLTKDAHPSDWGRQLSKVLRQIGFNSYMISLGPTPVEGNPLAGIITTFPKEWLEHYRCDGLINIDPILKHCRRELIPFFWDQERRRARGRSQRFWQERVEHGLRNGISIPLRYELLRGTLSVAFDADQAREHEAFCSEAVSQLFMLIPFMMAGLRHQLSTSVSTPNTLTPKEMECLHWAGAGKTTWEISHILGCSERTVDFHLLNARRKLGSVNRQQAVGIAAGCGLIASSTRLRLHAEGSDTRLDSRDSETLKTVSV